jgi:hypothetical protein
MPIPKHQEYERLIEKWTYAWEVYTGRYADADRIEKYLIQRKQGEANAAYKERKKLADPALDFSAVVDSLVGMQFASEHRTQRTWAEEGSEGLGDAQEKGTPAHRIRTNVDAEGTALETLLKRCATRLTAVHRVWGLVDPGVVAQDGTLTRPAVAHLISPEEVVNWRAENGRLVQVLVRDESDGRDDLRDDFDDTDYYTLYETGGWTRFKDDEGDLKPTGDEGEYAFWQSSDRRQRILPIFRVELPLPRMVGHLLARKCVALFNTESELDNLLRLCCMPRFGVATGENGYADFAEVVDKIREGQSVLEGAGHEYIAPPAAPATVRIKRLKQKRSDFYAVGFREYGDAASQTTATEKEQDWAAGVAAFLTLQAGALEAFDRQLGRRFEQAEYPEQPARWGAYDVSRSRDFQPENVRETLGKVADKVYGARTMPVDADTEVELIERYLDEHGFAPEKEGLREAVQQRRDREAQTAGSMGGRL